MLSIYTCKKIYWCEEIGQVSNTKNHWLSFILNFKFKFCFGVINILKIFTTKCEAVTLKALKCRYDCMLSVTCCEVCSFRYYKCDFDTCLPSLCSGKSLHYSVHGLSGSQTTGGPGLGGLLVHAGQLSAYSENTILGKHRGFDSVLFNLWPLANAGFRDA